MILVDAKDIRFYDQDGYLAAEGGCTQPKREVKIKKNRKKCRGLYCHAEPESAPEKADKSMNVYVFFTYLFSYFCKDYGQEQKEVL